MGCMDGSRCAWMCDVIVVGLGMHGLAARDVKWPV